MVSAAELHAGNGTPMKSVTLLTNMYDLDITTSVRAAGEQG